MNIIHFYFDNKTGDIIGKQSRQKKRVNTPINMTEHEHALQDKLYRIYDCGKIKLVIQNHVQNLDIAPTSQKEW